ncbi:hypothetical protein ADM96_33800 [Burkholderia sp. ST111]|nr:hypothetical protein ADM96_33800 [Burkholderia sp. ST111]
MIENDRSHKVSAPMALFACVAGQHCGPVLHMPFSNSHDDGVCAFKTPHHVRRQQMNGLRPASA